MTIQAPFLSSLRLPILSGSDVQKKKLRSACILAFFCPLFLAGFLAGPSQAEEKDFSDEPYAQSPSH